MNESKGISKLDLKRRNRKQILLAIRESGTLARVDIAKRLALTRAAVTIITNQMISQNILEDLSTAKDHDNEPKRKGRKKTLIRINPNFKFVLGAVISSDYISIGLSNLDGEVLDKTFLAIDSTTEQREIVHFILTASTQTHSLSSLLRNRSRRSRASGSMELTCKRKLRLGLFFRCRGILPSVLPRAYSLPAS